MRRGSNFLLTRPALWPPPVGGAPASQRADYNFSRFAFGKLCTTSS